MFSPPAAGEDTRGYLHGGIFIDFVGQKSPVSKITLALLDILLLGLQLVILAVVLERRKIGVPSASTDAAETSPVQPQVQDHDSEERGVLRPPLSEGIELQTLSSGRTGADQDHERDELLSPTSRDFQHPTDLAAVDEHPLNTFYSGQHIIADFYILDTIRTQWMQYSGVATAAGGTGPEIQATPRQGRVVGLQIGRFRIRGRLTA